MPVPEPSRSAAGGGVVVLTGRLWAGGVATGCIAALLAAVGVLLCGSVLNVSLVPTLVLSITDSLALNYAITAFVLALAATGVAHLLSVTTPRPRVSSAPATGNSTVMIPKPRTPTLTTTKHTHASRISTLSRCTRRT